MKIAFMMILFSSLSFAQNVGVKVNDIHANENTTIEIKKGSKADEPEFEITQGEENLEGDPAPLLKDARNNWKKACSDWKTEFKDLNKDNSILSMSCGTSTCSTQTMETTCGSKATYKLKVKIK